MKHISLDREDERIKHFVRSLPLDREGSVLEIQGEPILRILPIDEVPIDEDKLRAAIRNRREESRTLNAEWEGVDREVWEKHSDGTE